MGASLGGGGSSVSPPILTGTDQFAIASTNATQIKGPAAADLNIAAASAGASATGRGLGLTAGPGGVTTGTGGVASLTGGAAGANTQAGGAANVTGGAGLTTGVGGNANLTGGACPGANQGGFAQVTGGTGGGGGGGVNVNGGAGTNGSSGGQAIVAGGNGDAAGSNATPGGLQLGTGTGTGTAFSAVKVQTGFQLASGANVQAVYDREVITSRTKALSTTTGTATTLCNLANAITDSGVGCTIDGVIELIDGAHHVGSIAFTAQFCGVNQNGVVTAGAVVLAAGTGTKAINTGGTYTSLDMTVTATVSGTNVQCNVVPTWAAGTPTTVRCTYQVRANGQATVAPQ